jgi:hypothetical protein
VLAHAACSPTSGNSLRHRLGREKLLRSAQEALEPSLLGRHKTAELEPGELDRTSFTSRDEA